MFRLKTLLREPLLHFCLLGGGIFLLAGKMVGQGDEIVVNESLKKALASDYERKHGMEPTKVQLRGLIATWTDDEMLYREALRLGLDQSDDEEQPACDEGRVLAMEQLRHLHKYSKSPPLLTLICMLLVLI